MKEKINIDKTEYDLLIHISKAYTKIITALADNSDYLKRLKRLDDNVKIKIQAYHDSLKMAQSNKFYTESEIQKLRDCVELLEDLIKGLSIHYHQKN
jgi:hypothetical protein